MAEPSAGPSEESSDKENTGREICEEVHDDLTEIIGTVSDRLEVYLTAVQSCKVKLTSEDFDADEEGSVLESTFLRQTMEYIDFVYRDVSDLERIQSAIGTAVEHMTENWEELPLSFTTPAHLRHSQRLVWHWLMVWCQPYFDTGRAADQGDAVDENLEGEASGGVGVGGDLQLAGAEGASTTGVPEEAAASVQPDEGGADEKHPEDSDGNGNSNGEIPENADSTGNGTSDGYESGNGNGDNVGNLNSNGEESWNGNGRSNGNGFSNGEDNGNGISESLDSAITKYKPNSGTLRPVTGDSLAAMLNEVYRQLGILRRVLLRHTDRLWFLTRVRHREVGDGSLQSELQNTLEAVEVEMVEAQLEITRRAEVVRQLGDVLCRPVQPQPPEEESGPVQVHDPLNQPAGGFLRRLLGRFYYGVMACFPQRRNWRL